MNKTTQTYSWQRYLCPANESYARTADGFLIPPDESTLWRPNPHLRTVTSLAGELCLVILGEPGIGKSRVLQELAHRHRSHLGPNDIVIEEKFVGFATANDLRRELFQSPEVENWRRGTGMLYLFLDALDEAHERIDILMQALLRNLRSQPCERLFLRLSCRTTIWPSEYEQQLSAFWQLENLPVYKLAVLSHQDVQLAAKTNKVEPTQFIQALFASEVTPFAVVPVTLELLLQSYQGAGVLPKGRNELYASGCRHLCEENNPQHQRAKARVLTLEQRLLVAARIAALSLLGGYEVIDSSNSGVLAKETHLHRQALVGYSEVSCGQAIEVKEQAIKESLDTGLFIPLAPDQYVWVHRTCQEYLTAYYLVHRLTVEQILQLLAVPQAPNAQFPPQFRDLIGWLATLSAEVKQAILQRDPSILLTSDITTLTDENRVQLVDWLLTSVDQQQHFPGFDAYWQYQKLGHPGLADQLGPVLTDRNRPIETRRLAVDLAERNAVRQVQAILIQLALDSNCPLDLRVDAAQAVGQIGDDNTKLYLKPLLQDHNDDEQHQLKSTVLRALWPKHLTARELFAVLTPRSQESIIDFYHSFLTKEIVSNLQVIDLPIALAWVTQNINAQPAEHEIAHLQNDIIGFALLHLDVAEVRSALITHLLSALDSHDTILGTGSTLWKQHEFLSNETRRRDLFRLLLEECVNSDRDVSLLLEFPPSLITSSDLPWLLRELYPQLSESLQHALVVIIAGLWYHKDPEQNALIYEASQQYRILSEHFTHLFKPMLIDSEEAEQRRQQHQKRRRMTVRQAEAKEAQYVPQVDLRLAEAEADAKQWWRLNLELMATAKGFNDYDEHEHDIVKMPGWTAASEQIQQRIVTTALTYLAEGDPNNAYWVDNVAINYRPAQAGYRAFRLLYRTAPHYLAQLSARIWYKWSLTIVTSHRWMFASERTVDKALVTLLATNAPLAYTNAVVQSLQTAGAANEVRQLLERLADEWRSDFSTIVWQQIVQHDGDSTYLKELLPYLLHHDPEKATSYVTRYLPSGNAEHPTFSEDAMAVASDLLCHAQDAGWSILWPIIHNHSDFGKQLLLYTAHELRYSAPSLAEKLDVPRLAAFYQWLVVHFPYADDPPIPQGGYTPTPYHDVCRLRNSLLNALVNIGTKEAVDAIAEIVANNPTIPDGEHYLFRVREQWRHHSWRPIQPVRLLAFIHAQTSSDTAIFDQRNQNVGVQINLNIERFGL